MTLLEALVVLAIISIITSLAIPALREWRVRFREKTEVRVLLDAFQRARGEAARRNCEVLLDLTPAEDHTGGGFQILARQTDGTHRPVHEFRPLEALALTRSAFGGSENGGFDQRGLPLALGGSIHLEGRYTGRAYQISQSACGRLRIQ